MCDFIICLKRLLSLIVLLGNGIGGGFFMTFKIYVRIFFFLCVDFFFLEIREDGVWFFFLLFF